MIGVDWRTPLDQAWQDLGPEVAAAGQPGPGRCCSPRSRPSSGAVCEVLDQAAGRPGHIFNLGHGILPETPVENVRCVVDRVHELTRKEADRR